MHKDGEGRQDARGKVKQVLEDPTRAHTLRLGYDVGDSHQTALQDILDIAAACREFQLDPEDLQLGLEGQPVQSSRLLFGEPGGSGC